MDGLLRIGAGGVAASILPEEGGAVVSLLVAGREVLARTPWADAVRPGAEPAPDEAAWVRRWRGGWQACLPSTGQPDPTASPRQGFHGAASQAPWSVAETSPSTVRLHWDDGDLRAERTIEALPDGLVVRTALVAGGADDRDVGVAEHLVLDPRAFADGGGVVHLDADETASVAALAYDGAPREERSPWARLGWATVSAATGPRVAALLDPAPRRIEVRGDALRALIEWDGLPHALLWDEGGQSPEPPWNGAVHALGVEPTTTPHGAGTARAEGRVVLAPGGRLDWRVRLRILQIGTDEETP